MSVSLVFLASMLISGTFIIRLFCKCFGWRENAAGGMVIGIVVTTWFCFVLSGGMSAFRVWPVFWIMGTFSLIAVPFFGIRYDYSRKSLRSIDWVFWAVMILWSFFLIRLFSQMLFENEEGIWAGGSNVWGDWAGHVGYIANWIYGSNFPPQNPWFAGVRLSYPFLFDFTSAMLVELGMTIPQSMEIPGVLFSVTMIVLIYQLTVHLTRSRMAASASVFIFMFSGGLGFVYLCPDLPEYLQKLFPLPAHKVKELTHVNEANIQWVNFIISEMVPQRGILVGINVTLVILLIWLKSDSGNQKKQFFLSGVLASLIPFFHAHTFIVLAVIATAYFLMKPGSRWGFFFGPALILALPQFFYFLPQVAGYQGGFIRWSPGWLAHVQKDYWLWFWLKNLGLMFFLIPISWAYYFKENRKLFFGYLPFAFIFMIANLIIFQPWDYDNSKLLRFWYLASSILVAGWLVDWAKKAGYRMVIALVVFVSITLSGAVDASSWLDFERNKILMWSKDNIELAEIVREKTSKESVFLTIDAHNHWVVDLSGRKIVMGFRGWLWSWGINYQERERDVYEMFKGGASAKPLMEKYEIDYVIVGPAERSSFEANLSFFSDNYPLIIDRHDHKIFQIRESHE